jgi:hypothetical protein
MLNWKGVWKKAIRIYFNILSQLLTIEIKENYENIWKITGLGTEIRNRVARNKK